MDGFIRLNGLVNEAAAIDSEAFVFAMARWRVHRWRVHHVYVCVNIITWLLTSVNTNTTNTADIDITMRVAVRISYK